MSRLALGLDPLAMHTDKVSTAIIDIPGQLTMFLIAHAHTFAILHEAGAIVLAANTEQVVIALAIATSLRNGFILIAADVTSTIAGQGKRGTLSNDPAQIGELSGFICTHSHIVLHHDSSILTLRLRFGQVLGLTLIEGGIKEVSRVTTIRPQLVGHAYIEIITVGGVCGDVAMFSLTDRWIGLQHIHSITRVGVGIVGTCDPYGIGANPIVWTTQQLLGIEVTAQGTALRQCHSAGAYVVLGAIPIVGHIIAIGEISTASCCSTACRLGQLATLATLSLA